MADIATRFAADLYHSATIEGARQSRSAKQQLDHWARLGRAVAVHQGTARLRVEAAMAGELSTAELSEEEATVFNAEVTASVDERVAAANIGRGLAAQGVPYVALGDDGELVEYHPDGTSTVITVAGDVPL